MTSAAGMPCPVCRVNLVMAERQGVEIDYCPQCRGVWLDRGELDKIIARSADEANAAAPAPSPAAPPPSFTQPSGNPGYGQQGYPPQGYGHQGQVYGGDGHRYPKRRKSFLEELFD